MVWLAVPATTHAHGTTDQAAVSATVYFNEACGGCTEYLRDTLAPALERHGVGDVVWRDYVNETENRAAYTAQAEEWGVPFELRSHIMAYVGDDLVLAGHIPVAYLDMLLTEHSSDQQDRLIIYQDVMHGEAATYKIWAFAGPVQEYSISTNPAEYLDWFQTHRTEFDSEPAAQSAALWDFKKLFPLVIVSGFLDGINPCAFAVLLFFIAFLFTIRRTKAHIVLTGAVYILAIFIAYLLIGIGLWQAIIITGVPHLMAIIGSGLLLVLGIINIINVVLPTFPIKLRIPQFSKKLLSAWVHRATLPAAFILGILVGLCTFPCSGGIYVAIISLLAAQATYTRGLGYLLVYNLMFVLPLIIILLGASNKYVTTKLTAWEQSSSKKIRLWSGLIMVGISLIILLFFI